MFLKTDKLLLAFSGGVDSVVLATLLSKGGFKFELAHCNFNLRGKESDADEKFCIDFAKKNELKLHFIKFNTKAYEKEHKLSTQMAARELRYNWFKELVKEHQYNFILTAHHANDNIETLLVNLVRGTGINGLKGIPQKQNYIVRPLLFATKDSITKFAKQNKLKFRNDSSNDEVKYKRNFLRHEIIPKLKKLNASLENTFEHNIKLFNQSAGVIKQFIASKKAEIVSVQNNSLKINIEKLQLEEAKELLLHEWLYPFGFNPAQTEQLIESLSHKTSGKIFTSHTHKALIDRNSIIVEPNQKKELKKEFHFETLDELKRSPVKLEFEKTGNKNIIPGSDIAQIDFDKLNFPIQIRKWKQGDKFKPLGMSGYKKLSDFLIQEKLTVFEKENVWLLCNNDEVVWVIGKRMDDRYKITEKTKTVLKLQMTNAN